LTLDQRYETVARLSPRELINPPELFPPPGFSHVAIASGQRWVFLAGQTALTPEFAVVGEGDLAAQTRAAMESVGLALRAAGAGWEDVVRRTIYTVAPTEFVVIGDAIAEVTGEATHPPQTIIGVTGLALPQLMIEIEVTALLS
jgi:enamine deaminase RidA (YjgF/YER057c/UK114 family)